MRTVVTVVMASLLGMLLVSTAWATPTISCDFESNTTWSTAAYPDNTSDYDPDVLTIGLSGSEWQTSEEELQTRVQVTSYGTPGAHGGSKYLRLNRGSPDNTAMAQIFSGSGNIMSGPIVKIDSWLRSEGGAWQNQIAVYGSEGGNAVVSLVYQTASGVSYLTGGGAAWTPTGLTWTPGKWQHLILTLHLDTDKMSISLDNNTVDNLPFNVAATWVNVFQFAASGGPGDSYFDDIAISASFVSVTGQVTLNDFAGDLNGVGVKVELRPTGVGSVQTERVLLDANGRFTIPAVETGTYDIAIKPDGWLQKVISSVNVSSNPTDIGIIPFVSGDLNGGNAVNSNLPVVLANMDLVGDLGPGMTALSKGHRILLEKGLQIEAQAYPTSVLPYPDFDLPTWQASNFTGPNFETVNLAPDYHLPLGLPWSRIDSKANDNLSDPGYPELTETEMTFLPSMTAFQFSDGVDLDNDTWRAQAVAWVAQHKIKYPNVLSFTDQPMRWTTVGLEAYMQEAQPYMLMGYDYPFLDNGTILPVGGSPTTLYNGLAKFRNLALAGNDGSGSTPIPFGQYLQTYKGGWVRFPSDSEMRLQQFAGWTFGCTFARAWVYNKPQDDYDSPFFAGWGDTIDTATPAFYQIAETNRQSRNLGKTLVRLLSTDVRFIAGLHGSPPGVINTVPTGMSTWSAGADPYITGISATNLGATNNGLRGDVLIGYFKPLLESDDGSAYSNQIYFMITNGLSDPNLSDNVSATRQRIQIVFNFGSSGITSLQRLSRDTGLVETVPLTSMGGSVYLLTLDLDGGTGDLFKFNTGAPFIKSIDYVAPPTNYFQPVILCDFDNNSTVSTVAYPDPNGDFDPDTTVGGSWSTIYEFAQTDIQVTSYGTPGAHSGNNYMAINRSTGGAFARLFSGAGTPIFGPLVQISAWMRSDDSGTQNYISAFGSAGSNEVASVGCFGGGLSYLSAGGTAWTPTGLTYTQGIWQHLILTLDILNDNMSVSLDGNTVGNLPFNFATTMVNLFDFGANNNAAKPGYFDDIVISQISSTPTPGVTLTGQINLGDYSGDNASVGITVEFLPVTGGMIPLRTAYVLLDSTRHFTVNNCIPDTYNVAIKADTWLKKLITNVNLNSSANLGTIILVNGDSDGDNEVTSTDLAVVLMNMDLVGN